MMVAELFAPQLTRNGAPLCVLCGGKTMNGFGCTCAVERMWLYRATQGRLDVSACHIRDLTNDCEGGNNLRQMQAVSAHYGVTGGKLYQPINVDQVFAWIDTGRYAAHLDISYEPVVNTPHDAFGGRFRRNHDILLSNRGAASGTLRVGDPGGSAFHDWPKTLLWQAAGMLALNASGTVTLNDEAGRGKCYAYLTPIDPATPATLYHVVIRAPKPAFVQLYTAPDGREAGVVHIASYAVRRTMSHGLWWYQIVAPSSRNNGRWFKPSRYTHFTAI